MALSPGEKKTVKFGEHTFTVTVLSYAQARAKRDSLGENESLAAGIVAYAEGPDVVALEGHYSTAQLKEIFEAILNAASGFDEKK